MSPRRGLIASGITGVVALVATSAALAAPAVKIANVDSSGYPRLVVSVVAAASGASAPLLSENGSRVAGEDAVNLGATKRVVLAIDNSQSMGGGSLSDATDAARAFVDAKAPSDRVSVISFGRHAVQLTGFSTSSADAESVLGGLHVDRTSGTALYDAIIAASRSLSSSPDAAGRVIILLTDGHDVSSNATLEQAVAAAHRADAPVYPIGIESSDFDPAALETIARETGGTYHGVGSSSQLRDVYASIASELDRTWRIGYLTTARPGDRIDVVARIRGIGEGKASLVVASSLGGASSSSGNELPSAAYTPLGTAILSLSVGVLVLFAIGMIARLRRGSWVKQRLAAHVSQTHQRIGRAERASFFKVLFQATEGALGRRRQWRFIERMLVRGDVPLRVAEFFWLTVGCALIAAFIFGAAGAPGLLILVAMGVAGALPYGFVAMRVRRRTKAFENQLPDLLTTIAASLKAGHSFKHGLQAVVDESQPPASAELRRVLTEAGLGRPLDDALGDMADRIGSENFGFAITAVTIQRQVGGSLATLFDMVSETVRNRQQFARKIRSLTAMGRMSAYTLVGVPFFIAGMITIMNASYMAPLFHTHIGHLLLFIGLTMMAIGSLILKKIVSFRG